MGKILTVVVPSYNTEKYIDECLPTFLADEILDQIEILIVNDGSKDNTLEYAKKYEVLYPNTVKVIDKENGGHGSTINAGIKYANGTYFKVVDGDDWVDTKEFISFVHDLMLLKDIDMILNPFTIVNDKTKIGKKFDYPKLELKKVYSSDFVYSIDKNIQMHSITYKTEILKSNNILLDEKMFYVDQEYNLYPIQYIKQVIYLPQNIYQYRIFTETQSMNFKNLQKNVNMHKKVFFNLFLYQQENDKEMNNIQKQYYIRCLSDMAFLQIMIYLTFKHNNSVKEELLLFITEIKKIKLNWNRAPFIIRLFKTVNFKFYSFFNFYVRIRMRKELM